MWLLFYKVDRGPNAGNLAMVYAFENRTVRDAVFPGTEGASLETQAWSFHPMVEEVWGAMFEFLEETPGTAGKFADWILIR
jgi:hypothetical protein